MKFIFGPITSRRFGVSLGIDLSPARKQCNFNCVYCELGGAKTMAKMSEYPAVADVVAQLKDALALHPQTQVVTITANGEPTMYPKFGELVDALCALGLVQKLLVLTNGSLIRANKETLKKLDICKISLDSVLERSFRKIDGAHSSVELSEIISSLEEFACEFRGELDIEILVVEGLNDSVDDFVALNDVLSHINPDRIDLGTIDRPPAYNARAVSEMKLRYLATFIENQNINIVAKPEYKGDKMSFGKDEILHMLTLRPQRASDVESMFDEASVGVLSELVCASEVKFADGYYKILKQK